MGTLTTQATVVVVRAFGRCRTFYDDVPKHESLVAKQGSNLFLIERNKRIMGTQFGTIHLESYTTGRSIEERVADSRHNGIHITADINKRMTGKSCIALALRTDYMRTTYQQQQKY